MAQIPNLNALSEGDGLNVYVNIDTLNKILGLWNGAALKTYSDAGLTVGVQLIGGTIITRPSATAPDPGNGGTITTAGVGVAKVNPAAAETGVILQAGTLDGQEVTVINEAVAANSITFAAAATSNVADGASDVVAGLKSRTYVWEAGTARWYPML